MRTRKNTDILHMMFMGMMIVSIVLSLTGCPSDIPTTTVNAALYPFLDFTLDMATNEYVAKVIQGAKLTKLEIPGHILRNGKTVQVNVFGGYEDPADNATLKTLKLSPEIREIAAGALKGASNLESVDFGQDSKLEKIGQEAFKGTSLTRLDLPRQVTTIGDYAFADSKITDVTVSARTTATGNSGDYLFGNQPLENVTITGTGIDGDNDVGKLFAYTNHHIQVKIVRIGRGIRTIDNDAFDSNSSLVRVDLSESGVTKIGDRAFAGTSVATFAVPEGVEKFDWSSVQDCSSLKTVTLPSSLKETTSYQYQPASLEKIDVTYRLYLTEDSPEPIITFTVSYDPAKDAAEQADVAVELAKHITAREGFELAGVKAIGGAQALSSVNADMDGFTDKIPVDLLKGSQALPSYYPHRLCLTWADGNLEYTSLGVGNGYEVKLKAGAAPNRVEVLGYYKGLPVTRIATDAFKGCTTLTEAVLPSTINEIGDNAFQGCKALTSDIKDLVPSGVESVGEKAFYGAGKIKGDPSLSNIKNLTKLGKEAFYGCEGMTGSVVLPGIDIPEGAFNGCSGITQVTVPQDCPEIKKNAFLDCTALEEVVFKTKPDDGLTIGMGAFSGCGKLSTTSDGSVTINGKLALPEGLVHIEDSAFQGGAYHAVSLPSTLTTCSGGHIFQPAGAAPKLDVTIPANLTKTTYNVKSLFGANTTFGTVTVIPGKTDTIVADMFKGLPLEKLVVGEGITELIAGAFYQCDGLGTVVLPEGLKTVSSYAFKDTGLTEVKIPDTVTSLGWNCFSTGSLTTVTLPAQLTTDNGQEPFGTSGTSNVSEVTIRGTDKTNGKTVGVMFMGFEKLKTVTIGDGIESITMSAFSQCKSLDAVSLPDGLDTIGMEAFSDCTSLTRVAIPDGMETIGYGVFSGCTDLTTVILPTGLKTIEVRAFSGCTGLSTIDLPAGLNTIRGNAFTGTELEEVKIPNSVTTLGQKCFDISSLKKVTLPVHLTVNNDQTPFGDSGYGASASNVSEVTIVKSDVAGGQTVGTMFKDFLTLEKVHLEAGITEIAQEAFTDCISLSSDIAELIPSSVTTIGTSAFENCSKITGTPDLSQVTAIGSEVFLGCTGLSGKVTLPAVATIPYGIFDGCTGITGIDLDETTKTIDSQAFQNTGITDLDLKKVTYVQPEAFSGVLLSSPVKISKELEVVSVGDTFKEGTILDIEVAYSGSLPDMPWKSVKYTVGDSNDTLGDMFIKDGKLYPEDRGKYQLTMADGTSAGSLWEPYQKVTLLLQNPDRRTGTISRISQ